MTITTRNESHPFLTQQPIVADFEQRTERIMLEMHAHVGKVCLWNAFTTQTNETNERYPRTVDKEERGKHTIRIALFGWLRGGIDDLWKHELGVTCWDSVVTCVLLPFFASSVIPLDDAFLAFCTRCC